VLRITTKMTLFRKILGDVLAAGNKTEGEFQLDTVTCSPLGKSGRTSNIWCRLNAEDEIDLERKSRNRDGRMDITAEPVLSYFRCLKVTGV